MEKKLKFNEKPNVKEGEVGVSIYLSKVIITSFDGKSKEFNTEKVELTISFIEMCIAESLKQWGYDKD